MIPVDPKIFEERQLPMVHYSKDQIIYGAGALPRYVHYIIKGEVKMVTSNEEGDQFIQGIFSAGEFFGEPALLLNRHYLADTVATEPTDVYRLTEGDFLDLIHTAPGFAVKLLKILSNRLFYKSMMLEELANESAEHRLLTVIKYLLVPLKAGQTLNVTRKVLADMTGLRIETVIRTLRKLEHARSILMEKNKIIKGN